jgi:flagellar basal body L-ring protein FlgH
MKNTKNGFGLMLAVFVVAALTVGSIAAVKINENIKAEHDNNGNHATSTATTTTYTDHEGYLNANPENNGLMIGASSTIKINR